MSDREVSVAQQIFEGSQGSRETLASYALAEIYRQWAQTSEDGDREVFASLWAGLDLKDQHRVDLVVRHSADSGLDLGALFGEVLAHRSQLVSRAAALSASNRALNALIAKIVGRPATVLDPACGFGGTLAAVAGPDTQVTGLDVDARAAAIARWRLALDGVTADIRVGNALWADDLGKFEAVVCHPPQGTHLEPDQVSKSLQFLGEGRLGAIDGDAAWVQLASDHVIAGGRAVIVVSEDFLADRRQPRSVLEGLVDAGRLEALICLPADLVEGERAASYLLVVSGAPDPRKQGRVLVVDAPEVGDESERLEQTGEIAAAWVRDARQPAETYGVPWAAAVSAEDLWQRGFFVDQHVEVEPVPRPRPESHLLRQLNLSNFLVFEGETQIPLRPITLLYGKNSAGKSGLIKALRVLQSTVAAGHLATPTRQGTQALDALAHKRATDRPLRLGASYMTVPELDGAIIPDPAAIRSVAFTFTQASADEGAAETTIALGDQTWQFTPAAGKPSLLPGADAPSVVEELGHEFRRLTERLVHVGTSRRPSEDLERLLLGSASERDRVTQALARLGVHLSLVPHGEGLDQLLVREDTTGTLLQPEDVGLGVSHALPFVVELALRTASVIMVEQPETYLHPAMQADLTDLLIRSADGAGQANQVIVETHSETLILRLQRRIREQVLSAEDVLVLYVEKDEDGASQVRQLRLDSSGEFLDHWPDGFFDEQFNELFGSF